VLLGEAQAKGVGADAHLAHLVVHGVLHLLGHDHGGDAEADAMERLETRILGELGLGDPYAADDAPGAPAPTDAACRR
jgi:probable rRNA maturation factor